MNYTGYTYIFSRLKLWIAYKRDALEPLSSPLFARSRTERRFPTFWSISTPMTALNFSYWSRHQSVYCGCIGTDPRKFSSVFLSTRWKFHRKRSLSYCTGWYQCVRKVSETAITLPSQKVWTVETAVRSALPNCREWTKRVLWRFRTKLEIGDGRCSYLLRLYFYW